MHYSLTGRDVEHEIIPFMRAAGIGLTVWSPLAGGFLSGKYTRETLRDSENRLAGFDILPFDKEMGFVLVERMREMGKAHDASVAQVALAWLLAKPVVSGSSFRRPVIHQLEDNLGAIKVSLTAEEMAALDRATAPPVQYPNWFNERTVDLQHKEALGR